MFLCILIIGTRWFIDITILLTFNIPFVFYDCDRSGVDDIDVKQRHCGDDNDVDVDVDVEYRRSAIVDKNVADPKLSTS